MPADLQLVVGLGNPGPTYAGNRHNAGFLVLNALAERAGGRFRAHKGRADIAEASLGSSRLVLAKPKAYMNESGGTVAAVSRYFRVPASAIIVVHDELDLPFGALRVKAGGGDNGHNGLRSLRAALGTGEFRRVRFGIGRPPGRQDPADYVLRDFSTAERKELSQHVDRAADAVEALFASSLTDVQNLFNG